jgi:glycosyltransferase involved in cell wall biosynthesis
VKIAQVVCHFPPDWGGIATAVIGFSRELGELGHEVTVITPLYKEYVQAADDDFPFTVLRLRPLASSGRAAVLPQLLTCLKDHDVVNLHYPFYGSAELVALAKILHPSTRLKLHYHMDARSKGLKGLYFRLYARTVLPVLLRLADDIICSKIDYIESSDAAGYLRRHTEKFHEVPYGVDLDLFRPDAASLSCHSKTILFVGSLTRPGYFKGLENLIRALKSIDEKIEGCRLIVVGHGEMEPYYRQLADALDLGDRIQFVTNADDRALVACYRRCDVLVLPPFNRNVSRHEDALRVYPLPLEVRL